MLDFFRNNQQNLAIKIILGLVVVVMAFFGLGSLGTNEVNVIANVNGDKIFLSNYQEAFDQELQRLQSRGQNVTGANRDRVSQSTFGRLVNQALVAQSAREAGFAVTDLELSTRIRSTPQFQTDDRFDKRAYDRYVSSRRMTRVNYEDELRKRLLIEKYINFVDSGIRVSGTFLKTEFSRNETEFQLQVIRFNPNAFQDEVTVTEAQAKAYYTENAKEFEQKKKFNVEYFKATLQDTLDSVKVRDLEIQNYYEKNLDERFTRKNNQLHARHILISFTEGQSPDIEEAAKKRIGEIYTELEADKSKFSALAKKYSEDPSSKLSGGDLGWVNEGEGKILSEIEDATRSLKNNELTAPFKSNLGYHIAELLGKRSAGPIELDDTLKQEITELVKKNKAARSLQNKTNNIQTLLAGKAFAEVAKEQGKDIKNVNDFAGGTFGSEKGSGFSFYRTIETQNTGDTGIFKFSEEESFIYHITKTVAPQVSPFEEVKAQAEAASKRRQLGELAAKKAQEFSQEIKTLDEFKALAPKVGATAEPVGFKMRDRFIPGIGLAQTFKDEVFAMGENDAVKLINENGVNYLVYKVEKKAGEVDQESKEFKSGQDIGKQIKSGLILNEIVKQIRDNTPIDYNREVMASLNLSEN